MTPIKVLLADDQALLRSAFRILVDSEPDMQVVGEAADGAEAVAGTGVRPREPYDGATPAAMGVLAEALTYAGRLAQSQEDSDLHVLGDRWLVEARRILDAHGEAVERHLSAAGGWLCALEAHLARLEEDS